MSTDVGTIRRIVVLGGSGDLMMRFLVPALAELAREGKLREDVSIIGVARGELGTAAYRKEIEASLAAAQHDTSIASRFAHVSADVSDATSIGRVVEGSEPALVYFALPQTVVPKGVAALAKTRLPAGSRIAIEKPFGGSVQSARALNALLAEHFDEADVFRIDHFLAMRSVRTLLVARLVDRMIGSIASAEHIERVEIVWDETLGLEHRAGYYDGSGALEDMVQSHLLQVLAMIAMPPPSSLDPRDVARCRVAAFERMRLLDPERPERCVVRARYGEGTIDGRRVLAYADEEGVDPAKETETFVQLELRVDEPRWADVPFVIRTGKALERERKEVVLVLRRSAGTAEGAQARIVFGLEPEGFRRDAFTAGDGWSPEPTTVSWTPERAARPPYAEVLDGILRGDQALFVTGPETELAWGIVEPALTAFREGRVKLGEYAAGSDGPSVDVASDGRETDG